MAKTLVIANQRKPARIPILDPGRAMSSWRKLIIALCSLAALAGLCQALLGWPLQRELHVPAEGISVHSDRAFRASIKSVVKRLPIQTSLLSVRENGVPLHRVNSSSRVRFGPWGTFNTAEKTLFFSSTDGSDPRHNGRTYTLVAPKIQNSTAWWLSLMALVALGLALGREGLFEIGSFCRILCQWMLGKCRLFASLRWLQGSEWPLSYAIARVAVGLAFWLLSPVLGPGAEHLMSHDMASYTPVGPFCFLCPNTPSPLLIDISSVLLPITSMMVIAGLLTRLSLIVSIFSLWVLTSGVWLFGAISHGWQPFLLAALPLLAARSQQFSIDGLFRRYWKPGPLPPPSGTRLAVLGTQIMVSLVFLSAAAHKIYLGNGEFMRWAFSDSLRNLILAQYFVTREEMHPFLNWTLSHEPVWRGLALTAIVCQTLPFVGVFFIRRPWLRLLCGLALIMVVISLRLVMGLFPQEFLLIAVVFVEWEYFVDLVLPAARCWLKPLLISETSVTQRSYVIAILILEAIVAFATPKPIPWLFPFTSFPMFSTISASPPWTIHKPYMRRESTWKVTSDPPLPQSGLDYLWRGWHDLPWNAGQNPTAAAADVLANIEQLYHVKVTGLELNGAVFEIQPHPSKDIVLRYEVGFVRHENGRTRAMKWQVKQIDDHFHLEFEPQGFSSVSVKVYNVPFGEWKAVPIACEPSGNRVELTSNLYRPGWIVFVSKDAAGREETWAGPYLY